MCGVFCVVCGVFCVVRGALCVVFFFLVAFFRGFFFCAHFLVIFAGVS